jgi:hypothetical protein
MSWRPARPRTASAMSGTVSTAVRPANDENRDDVPAFLAKPFTCYLLSVMATDVVTRTKSLVFEVARRHFTDPEATVVECAYALELVAGSEITAAYRRVSIYPPTHDE